MLIVRWRPWRREQWAAGGGRRCSEGREDACNRSLPPASVGTRVLTNVYGGKLCLAAGCGLPGEA